MENTVRKLMPSMDEIHVDGAAVLDAARHRENAAIEQIKNEVALRTERGARRIVANLAETGEASTFTIKVKVSYNKENEVLTQTTSVTSLPDEPSEERGEILEGQNLKFW